jgi:putative ABC transport system permease protein
VQKVYISQGRLRNIWNYDEFPITIYGLDTWNPLMDFPGLKEHAQELELADHLLFDGLSRTTYGPILQYLETHENLETELNYRKVKIIDEIKVGISFNTDGNLYLSYANFYRLFPQRDAGNVDLGLVKLKPGYDPVEVRKALADFLGKEVQVKTYAELLNSEIAFLRENAPLDFIFGMGAAVGFFIGFVVVYQILYTEVVNHLPQFATMKAMGFDDWYLMKIVITQALLLSVLGYFPGFMLALWLYDVATTAIQMQFSMTWYRGIGVFLATVFMCSLSALIAIQKARTADPADVF